MKKKKDTRKRDSLIKQHPELLAAIGKRFAHVRTAIGMSLDTFAKLSGVSQTVIVLLEKGVTTPSLPVIFKMSDALGVSLSHLLHGIDLNGNVAGIKWPTILTSWDGPRPVNQSYAWFAKQMARASRAEANARRWEKEK